MSEPTSGKLLSAKDVETLRGPWLTYDPMSDAFIDWMADLADRLEKALRLFGTEDVRHTQAVAHQLQRSGDAHDYDTGHILLGLADRLEELLLLPEEVPNGR